MKPIRIMIADDQAVVRRGLSVFLLAFSDFDLVGQATNGLEALEMCGKLTPDVVLMDVQMPQMDGITATQHIHQQYPHIRVIGLTGVNDSASVQKMLDAGAVNYLFKNTSIDDIAKAIRCAGRG